jgi:hypothetical protein
MSYHRDTSDFDREEDRDRRRPARRTSRERPRLGSLAQSARSKKLNEVRTLLIIIGVLNFIVAILVATLLRDQLPSDVYAVALGTSLGFGALYVLFGLIVHQFPVPITIISLVLYVGVQVISGVMDPESIPRGLILKVIIIVALAKSIQTAVAYENERSEERRRVRDEDEYDDE